jgi:hypothetical protein
LLFFFFFFSFLYLKTSLLQLLKAHEVLITSTTVYRQVLESFKYITK